MSSLVVEAWTVLFFSVQFIPLPSKNSRINSEEEFRDFLETET
jgi:hypothetical protein